MQKTLLSLEKANDFRSFQSQQQLVREEMNVDHSMEQETKDKQKN